MSAFSDRGQTLLLRKNQRRRPVPPINLLGRCCGFLEEGRRRARFSVRFPAGLACLGRQHGDGFQGAGRDGQNRSQGRATVKATRMPLPQCSTRACEIWLGKPGFRCCRDAAWAPCDRVENRSPASLPQATRIGFTLPSLKIKLMNKCGIFPGIVGRGARSKDFSPAGE